MARQKNRGVLMRPCTRCETHMRTHNLTALYRRLLWAPEGVTMTPRANFQPTEKRPCNACAKVHVIERPLARHLRRVVRL